MSWEEASGKEYRRAHKREHYDAVTIQIRKDGGDGFTRDDLNKMAEAHGVTVGGYIKSLVRAAMGKNNA